MIVYTTFFGGVMQVYCHNNFYQTQAMFTKPQVDLMFCMRMLWEQHGVWTRAAITSLVFGLPDTDAVLRRLLRNPSDFAPVLERYYGRGNASRFRGLLTEHLVLAADLVKAVKAKNERAAAEAERKWYANADAIAAFLGQINPFWSYRQWRVMLRRQLDLVKAEAVNMLTKNYEAGVAVYDEIQTQALGMADVMADGIVRQFLIQ